MEKYIEEYNNWIKSEKIRSNSEVYQQLIGMRWDTDLMKDCFRKDIEFGTSGLRGLMGAGTNRINVFTISKMTQGVADYLKKNDDDPTVIIAYDSRKGSRLFAETAAGVLAGNGIPVYMFREHTPVPVLSYSIGELGSSLGIAITASHNSKEYNGYKVYNCHGYQLTDEVSMELKRYIDDVDIFSDIVSMDFDDALRFSLCAYVEEDIFERYLSAVRESADERLRRSERKMVNNYAGNILYTPLYGAGYRYVTALLNDIKVVESQIDHDGDFSTCPYPNPEKREAYREAIKVASENDIDCIMATDPDSDRFGLAYRTGDEYRVFTGNEIALLLFTYICETRRIPKHGIAFRSIVSTPLFDRIAAAHGITVRKTLTGFKYIGEALVHDTDLTRFVFAFEESNGFLAGTYSMDKDGVGAAYLAARMINRYGNPVRKLQEIYDRYGYSSAVTYEYKGKIDVIRAVLESDGFDGCEMTDYSDGKDGLPPSYILKIKTADNGQIYIRPSGTEPKTKIYIYSDSDGSSESILEKLKTVIEKAEEAAIE